MWKIKNKIFFSWGDAEGYTSRHLSPVLISQNPQEQSSGGRKQEYSTNIWIVKSYYNAQFHEKQRWSISSPYWCLIYQISQTASQPRLLPGPKFLRHPYFWYNKHIRANITRTEQRGDKFDIYWDNIELTNRKTPSQNLIQIEAGDFILDISKHPAGWIRNSETLRALPSTHNFGISKFHTGRKRLETGRAKLLADTLILTNQTWGKRCPLPLIPDTSRCLSLPFGITNPHHTLSPSPWTLRNID